MSKEIKIRRGTAAENAVFTGVEGEVTYSTDEKRLITHDGVAVGGEKQAKKSEVDLKEDVANKDIDGTLAANSDVRYASQKATKTYVDAAAAVAAAATSLKVAKAGDTMSGDLNISTGIHLDTDGSMTLGVSKTSFDINGRMTKYRNILASGSGLVHLLSVDEYTIGTTYTAGIPDSSDNIFHAFTIPADATGGLYELTISVDTLAVNMVSGGFNINMNGVIMLEFPDLSIDSPLLSEFTFVRYYFHALDSTAVNITYTTVAATAGVGDGSIIVQGLFSLRKLS